MQFFPMFPLINVLLMSENWVLENQIQSGGILECWTVRHFPRGEKTNVANLCFAWKQKMGVTSVFTKLPPSNELHT